jgi:outer membrane receptor protein involved in Fe transport
VFVALLLSAFLPVVAWALPAADADLTHLSLEELMQVKVAVASNKERSIRDQPGVVSVLTEAEIRSSGARNLMDLLAQVPGFYFGYDIQGAVGPVFRGMWAYEGKTLLIVDGVEMNEAVFGTVQLEHRLSADLIKQVEIIRGPGSALYGGSAELAVIRVTTKGAEQGGGFASATVGFSGGRLEHDYSVGYGDHRGLWHWSFNGSFGEEFRSARSYTDMAGASYSLRRDSDAEPKLANLGFGYRDLEVRVLYESIPYEERVNLGPVLPAIQRVNFDTVAVLASYPLQVTPWMRLTPSAGYYIYRTWQVRQENANDMVDARRPQAGLEARISMGERANVLVGSEYRRLTGQAKDESYYAIDAGSFFNGRPSVTYDILSLYSQYEQETPIANFTAGVRYEHHSWAGGAFVPRFAVTRAWDRWHVKALYSEAFRTPDIRVISGALTGSIKPEHTRSYEVEVGYRFSDHFSWTGNLFYTRLRDPIVYTVIGVQDGYLNFERVATYGFETEFRASWSEWDGILGYSSYYVDQNTVAPYFTPAARSLLGAPNHKVTASSVWRFHKDWLWNLNGTVVTDRYAYLAGGAGLGTLPPEWMLNTFLEYHFKPVRIGVGVNNLLNQGRWYPQMYDGGTAPFPGMGREWFLRVRAEF